MTKSKFKSASFTFDRNGHEMEVTFRLNGRTSGIKWSAKVYSGIRQIASWETRMAPSRTAASKLIDKSLATEKG